ncbi:MAG: aromatic ring-hydroxylating oxygenase subunit alpha [Rhodanobacteraceae bacterium]
MKPAIDHDLAAQPLDHAFALPARFYVGAPSEQRDRRAIFAHSWQLLARAGQLAGPGDHVVAEIAGVPLLLVRGSDGILRALHNVCRHRAGPLALCDGRGAKRLRCHYHGWSYGLDGRLLGATEMDDACDFDAASIRLPKAQVAEWRGLVFAALDPAVSFTELFSGLDARVGGRPLAEYVFHRHYEYDIACDWKAYVDNYLEGYHVPHIHPELNRMLDYRDYVIETARWHSLQHSPLASDKQLYGNGEALYWFVWPNTLLNVLPDRMQTNRVIPLAPGRCRVTFDYFYPRDSRDVEARHASDHAFSDLVQRQDIGMCEIVQRGLESGSYDAGRLNPKRENGVHHFHELLREAYRTFD